MMNIKLKVRIIIIIFCIFMADHAIVEAGQIETKKFVLENGLTVLISAMPGSSSVSVYGLVKIGSATEGKFLGSGLTHFMEHMLFKGTERRGVGDISDEVQSLGGTINASTHFDFTIYTLTVPKRHFQQAVDILSDMLMNSKFDPDELEREREVIYREINMHYDRPEQYLSKKVFETAYHRHPYRIPIIGYEDLLRPLKRDDFLKYYQDNYHPNNMVLSIAGDVDVDAALTIAKEYFEKYSRGSYQYRNLEQEPNQVAERLHHEEYATELLRMSISYQGVDVLDEDMVALDALSMVLGSGKTSRLYQALYDQAKLVHSISASNFTPYDRGLFEIEVTADHHRWEDIVAAVDQEIDRLVQKGVTDAEMERIISATLKSRYETELVSQGVAYRTAVDEALTGKYDFTHWYLNAFKTLTPKDLVRVAKKYLQPEKRSIVVIEPKKDQDAAATVEHNAKEKMEIEKVVLENGLRVLLRPDDTVPLVWINLVVNGGIYKDPAAFEGLSNLTARVWIKGSKKFDKDDIAQLTEQKGVSFSSFSGRQSMGIQMSLLKRDLDFALKLLSDIVMNPTFLDDSIKDEKRHIKTAIMSRNNNINEVASILFYQQAFIGHPLGQTVLGTVETVEAIQREHIVEFYTQAVTPKQSTLSVFGDIDPDSLESDLAKYFKNWKESPQEKVDALSFNTKITGAVEKVHHMDKEQAMLVFGFQAESFHHEDRYGLELLGAVLGSPFKGRMFNEIREQQGLSYRLGGGFSPAKDAGALVFSVQTVPENIDDVKEIFKDIIRDLQENEISDSDLEGMKAYLIGRHERSLDTNSSLSFLASLDELYGLGFQYYQDYEERITKLQKSDIQRLAKKYLNLEHMVQVTILPTVDSEKIEGYAE